MKPQKRIRGGKVRWVARYIGADGKERTKTFDFERDAKGWVRDREKEVRDGDLGRPEVAGDHRRPPVALMGTGSAYRRNP